MHGGGEGRGDMSNKRVRFKERVAGPCGAALTAALMACCAVAAAPAWAQLQDERAVLVRSEVTATVPLSRGWSGEAGGLSLFAE